MLIQVNRRPRAKREDDWITVAPSGDLPEGAILKVNDGTGDIVLVRTREGLFALDAECPHQGGPLERGSLGEGTIRCPLHAYEFDLRTGRGVGNDLTAMTVAVRETDGNLS